MVEIRKLIENAHANAVRTGHVLVVELGLASGRSLVLAVAGIGNGIIRGLPVSPSLSDRWLPEKPEFRQGQIRLPVEVAADRVDAVIRLEIKPKRLEAGLRSRLTDLADQPI